MFGDKMFIGEDFIGEEVGVIIDCCCVKVYVFYIIGVVRFCVFLFFSSRF